LRQLRLTAGQFAQSWILEVSPHYFQPSPARSPPVDFGVPAPQLPAVCRKQLTRMVSLGLCPEVAFPAASCCPQAATPIFPYEKLGPNSS